MAKERQMGHRGALLMAGSLAALAASMPARAQPPPAPSAALPAPVSAPAALPGVPLAGNPPSREAQLEERLRRMEQANDQLLRRLDALSKQYDDVSRKLSEPPAPERAAPRVDSTVAGVDAGDAGRAGSYERYRGASPVGPEGTIGRGTPSSRYYRPGEETVGIGGGGRIPSFRFAPPSTVRTGGDTTRGGGPGRGPEGTIGRRGTEGESRAVKVTVGNGLRFDTEDEEFQLQFHDLTQTEYRGFPGVGDQSPLKSQFFIPRQRWYFTGRATKNVEFYTVINRGYSSLDLLDAFLNLNFDPRIQFRLGRTKTPTSYEYYMIAEGDLIAPERSLYIGNLAGNRQNGWMAHGVVFDKRAEYAIGAFNGPRRSFQDFNSDKDLYLFYNMRPWQNSESLKALNYLNIGGAANFGNENNPLQPNGFSTANDQTSNATNIAGLSPVFFQFNNNVMESGYRAHWSGWLAWYYKSFNVLAEYDGGFQNYALTSTPGNRTSVPFEGWFVTGYYFLTGEQIKRRVDVQPLADFAIRNGRITGPGAVEVFSRFSALDVGGDVFRAGFADPNLWSNHAYAIDTGLNWYWNRYTKIYIDWQHSVFGNPVYNGSGALRSTTNLFWLRFQLFF
jgi:phosphate-selective porin OprO/OprP